MSYRWLWDVCSPWCKFIVLSAKIKLSEASHLLARTATVLSSRTSGQLDNVQIFKSMQFWLGNQWPQLSPFIFKMLLSRKYSPNISGQWSLLSVQILSTNFASEASQIRVYMYSTFFGFFARERSSIPDRAIYMLVKSATRYGSNTEKLSEHRTGRVRRTNFEIHSERMGSDLICQSNMVTST